MFLSVFFVPLVFGVQLPDDLPEEFEAEMNYFLKYKTAQKIANDTKLAETKDIKVLVIHPDTRKVRCFNFIKRVSVAWVNTEMGHISQYQDSLNLQL